MEGARTTTNIFPEAGRGISVLLGLLNSITFKLYPVEWTPIFLGLPILWTVFLG